MIMAKNEIIKEAEQLVKNLPEDAGWEDLMYTIYVRQSIEQGLKDVEEGRVSSHEDIKSKFQQSR